MLHNSKWGGQTFNVSFFWSCKNKGLNSGVQSPPEPPPLCRLKVSICNNFLKIPLTSWWTNLPRGANPHQTSPPGGSPQPPRWKSPWPSRENYFYKIKQRKKYTNWLWPRSLAFKLADKKSARVATPRNWDILKWVHRQVHICLSSTFVKIICMYVCISNTHETENCNRTSVRNNFNLNPNGGGLKCPPKWITHMA